jgi:hypothetical protein
MTIKNEDYEKLQSGVKEMKIKKYNLKAQSKSKKVPLDKCNFKHPTFNEQHEEKTKCCKQK